MKVTEEEMKCPKCSEYMKEFVTMFRCRNLSCRLVYQKKFQHQNIKHKDITTKDTVTLKIYRLSLLKNTFF